MLEIRKEKTKNFFISRTDETSKAINEAIKMLKDKNLKTYKNIKELKKALDVDVL